MAPAKTCPVHACSFIIAFRSALSPPKRHYRPVRTVNTAPSREKYPLHSCPVKTLSPALKRHCRIQHRTKITTISKIPYHTAKIIYIIILFKNTVPYSHTIHYRSKIKLVRYDITVQTYVSILRHKSTAKYRTVMIFITRKYENMKIRSQTVPYKRSTPYHKNYLYRTVKVVSIIP